MNQQTLQSQLQAAGNTGSGRMQALAVANAAMNLKKAADAVQAGQAVKDANAADKTGGIGISISVGSSSTNQSKSASVGVAMQLGNGGGMGYTASASKATGQGAGSGVTYTNTQVAGSVVNIESGGGTKLKGAVVKADQVTADVGSNLGIQSLQDQNQYKESSKSAGGSIMVGAGFSGSVNLAKSSITSNYQSVGEQSAIQAGSGGFQVEVKGNTILTPRTNF